MALFYFYKAIPQAKCYCKIKGRGSKIQVQCYDIMKQRQTNGISSFPIYSKYCFHLLGHSLNVCSRVMGRKFTASNA